MTTITIPKELKKDDLVTVPRKIYQELIDFKKKMAPTFKPTKSELRMIEQSRRDYKNGNFIEWTKLKDELDNRYRRSNRKKT